MCDRKSARWAFAIIGLTVIQLSLRATETAPPRIIGIGVKDSKRTIQVAPYPATQEIKILRAESLDKPFVEDGTGLFSGYDWVAPLAGNGPMGFYRMQVAPINEKDVLAATVLSRFTYGPTPDDLERVSAIGPEAYIEEQLAPEKIDENLDIDAVASDGEWQYVTVTGTGSSSTLYIYLTLPGEGYIDDLKLVPGSVAEAGVNLIRNGDFELPLTISDWTISTNMTASAIVPEVKHSGAGSLHLVATSGGSTRESAIWQTIRPSLAASQTYTLSYWYLPSSTQRSSLTIRLSGSGIVSSPDSLMTALTYGTAEIDDLQAWFTLHAVRSKRQLLEVLTQFFDNHFTTYFAKSRDYLDGSAAGNSENFIGTDFEFRELKKWREALMNPNSTFYDLLKVSAESPAMIIYLDTVASKAGAANENYARELLELFTMGVDNGYDQHDIEELSRAWTGWRVSKLPLDQKDNHFATAVTKPATDPGYWTYRFSRSSHDTAAKTIFPNKTIDARFGPPYAGKSYELKLAARTDTAGIKDGYDVIGHLADLPYTQEYLSVKLCRLFVHENFVHGVYDYTDPNLSPEGRLVFDCMKAWDTPAADGRKGNLRNVLRVIFNSSLFRQQTAARQKVKSPFEFVVSTVRALRAARPAGGFTADSTGYDLADPMNRIGMRLFYREEPDGWSEFGRDWINTSSLVERMRFVQTFLKVGNKQSDPVGLLKLKLPSAQWRDAAAVAEFFVNLLFLGEGKANLDLDRSAAIAFLNRNEAGTAASAFSTLDPNSATYDARVRGMLALLLGLPRFEEQ